ncbi:diguanylate cyclase [Vibrio sp.]|uniref:diguanylate cyclase n=1 Tax=Vibrio viridaestus TaxID=2487322 RepID=A0A3N9TH72_9VIBR|nr:sensor domain-containing diguanylate cyclase [Vibrio viridaestus]MDC0610723.1 diguanylate cyclase [Vibrio sp.]RQW63648.1 diguanylate cyclase [Vibrio viridaestus]
MRDGELVILFDAEGLAISASGDNQGRTHLSSFLKDICFIDDESVKFKSDQLPAIMQTRNHIDVTLKAKNQTLIGEIRKTHHLQTDEPIYIGRFLCDQLFSLIHSIPAVVFRYKVDKDHRGTFTFVSPQASEFFCIKKVLKRQLTKQIISVIHEDDIERVKASMEKAITSGSEWQCDFRIQIQNQIKWVYGHALPTVDTFDASWWDGFFIDISEKKSLELKLIKESTVDPLTSAYNRRYFIERLDDELKQCRLETNKHLSLLTLDFDYFKSINDQYGHDAGDNVLQSIVKLVLNNIRKTDCFARVGGEEFSLILSETDYKAALSIAEKLRMLIAEKTIDYRGSKINITVTIGVASTEQGFSESKQLMRAADRALYEGKDMGRNCVK